MSPGKCQIWTRCIWGGMLIVGKKLNDKLGRKFRLPFNLGVFPSRKHGTSSVMVRFMKGIHDDISQTFSNFTRAWWGHTMAPCQASCFSSIYFIFSIVENPINKHFGWLLPHISLKYMSIPCKRHENLLNGTSMVYKVAIVHAFMHRLFGFKLCAIMPRKCT